MANYIPQLSEVNKIFTEIPFPKSVKWENLTIKLDDHDKCFEKFGFIPGTILTNPSHHPVVVLGIGKKNKVLWVGNPLNPRKSSPLDEMIQNQEDLKKYGYEWTTSFPEELNNRKRKFTVDDSPDAITRINKIFKQQKECDVFFLVKNKKIGAHAVLLMEASDYFRAFFEGNFKESANRNSTEPITIPFDDFEPEHFEMLLEYVYSGLITIDPDNILSIAHLADYFDVQKLRERSETCLSQFLNPDNALTYFNKAFQHAAGFFLLPTIETYINQHVSEIVKQDKETLLNLSDFEILHLIEKAPEDLKKTFFEAVLNWVEHPETEQMVKRMQCLIENISPLLPKDENAFYQYAEILSKFIHSEQKRQKFKESIHLIRNNNWMLTLYAKALLDLQQLHEAKVICEKILSLEPENVFALFNYAHMLSHLKQFDLAKENYEKGLQIQPKNVNALFCYASTLFHLKQFDLAKENFEKGLKVQPENVIALFGYAETLYKLGQFSLAKENFEKVIKIQPKNVNPLFIYAETLYKLGQFDLAKENFEKGLKIQPKNVMALFCYANTLFCLKQFDLAKENYEKGLKIQPEKVNTLLNYANTLPDLASRDFILRIIDKS
jgi:tetratricopeptide (TPR) repeat protein